MELHKMNVVPAFDCFIFHDVDLVPENEHNLYRCNPSYPKRFIWSRDKNNYRYVSKIINHLFLLKKILIRALGPWFGGAGGMTPEQFQRINGYSNHYWGWGAEDDDMQERSE
jgi:beta-1,4-galactosyltransferase 4